VSTLAGPPEPETRRLRPISHFGVNAIEYGVLLLLIALMVIGIVSILGGNLGGIFLSLANTFRT
jgi:Flp pilus assembly pilin Flp